MSDKLSHYDDAGEARMVDVSAKDADQTHGAALTLLSACLPR